MTPQQIDTTLAEFTYTLLRQLPPSRLRLLPERLFKVTMTQQAAARFAAKSSDQDKRELFSCLGLETYTIIADLPRESVNDVRFIFKEYDIKEKPSLTIKKLADSNVFITGNKQHCELLGHLTQLLYSDAYPRQMELIRSSHHLRKFRSKIQSREHTESKEAQDLSDHFGKVMHGVLWAADVCEQTTSLDLQALRVLLYFYNHKQSCVSVETLITTFSGAITAQVIGKCRKRLSDALLIQRHSAQTKAEYTITGRGILIVNQFRDKVIKSFDF